jgi:DNA repair protein RadD
VKLRDYQEYAVNSIFEYFGENSGNPVVAMPTGTGKSLVIGGFIRDVMTQYPDQRILMATHVQELIEQNAEKLLALWPNAPLGIYSAGLHRKEAFLPVVYGGVKSLIGDIDGLGYRDLLLVDEAHLISPRENTQYQQLINGLSAINPKLKTIGFTATPYRLGQGMVTDGGILTDICCDMTSLDTFNWFIDEGYLVNLVPQSTETQLNIDGVGIQNGDFNSHDLQKAVDVNEITYKIVKEIIKRAYNRKSWLIFGSGIEHCKNITECLQACGISAVCVHSKMPTKERTAAILAHKRGEYQAIVSNGVLTTGYDNPVIDLIAMLRPTTSPGLWVQMLGRGTRPCYALGFDLSTTDGRLAAISNSEKPNCLVLDFAKNTQRLGPINDPIKPRKKGEKVGEAPIKICPECGVYNHCSARQCTACGYQFPKYQNLVNSASSLQLIKKKEPVVVNLYDVSNVVYTKHSKTGGKPTLKCTYFCGLRRFSEYLCFEHIGYARERAKGWWKQRVNDTVPSTIDEALLVISTLRKPRRIRVAVSSDYPEVLSYEF